MGFFNVTPLVSNKAQLFTGWRDLPMGISFFEKKNLQFFRLSQKLVVILENKVVQNLKLEKKCFKQKMVS